MFISVGCAALGRKYRFPTICTIRSPLPKWVKLGIERCDSAAKVMSTRGISDVDQPLTFLLFFIFIEPWSSGRLV
jgi:hypothetical protein